MWDIYIFRAGVIRALVSIGHEVVVVAPDDGRIDMEKAIPGAKSISINLNKRYKSYRRSKLTLELYSYMKRLEYNFSLYRQPNIYGTLAAKMAGEKIV